MKKVLIFFLLNGMAVSLRAEVELQKKYTIDYKDPERFLAEFVDTGKRPNEPLRYWALQLILLLQKDPQLHGFCKELAQTIKFKNPMRIAGLFIRHQHFFSPQMQNYVFSRGVGTVYKALETRSRF